MARQIPLDLESPEPFSQNRFVRTKALAPLVDDLLTPQHWPAPQACLTGPEGSGKTHLLHMFAAATGAACLTADETHKLSADQVPFGPVAIDDSDRAQEDLLFHLFNRAVSSGHPLLLASATQPLAWRIALPDLVSRVRSLRVLSLQEPDDDLLSAILRKLFDQRAIRPSPDAIEYLLRRMDRSVGAAQKIVTELEQYANGRAFNRALVRDFFNESDPLPFAPGDPFDSA